MAVQSESTRFRASCQAFESALQAYEKKVGFTLAEHPLAVQLQSCDTVQSITIVLQAQAQAFGQFPGSDRLIKSIKSIVSILNRLSASPSLGDDIGLVRHNSFGVDGVFHSPDDFYSHTHL